MGIKLGKMSQVGTLTFEKYNEMKMEHKDAIEIKLSQGKISFHDFKSDPYGKLDAMMTQDALRNVVRDTDGHDDTEQERQRIRDHFPERKGRTKENDEILLG